MLLASDGRAYLFLLQVFHFVLQIFPEVVELLAVQGCLLIDGGEGARVVVVEGSGVADAE